MKPKKITRNKYQDLFQTRRVENNISLPLLKSNKDVITIGIISGVSVISIPIFISFILFIQSIILSSRNEKLKPYLITFNKLDQLINNLNNKNKALSQKNEELKQDLRKIRSGSAIFSELSSLTPKAISLSGIDLEKNKLLFKGFAFQENGLRNINLFLLVLEDSKFIIPNTTRLINIESFQSSEDKNKIDKLKFTIKAELIDNFSKVNTEYINKLGSMGLSKRVRNIPSNNLK